MPTPEQEPPPLAAALTGTCPRCGAGKLFAGFVAFADRCQTCGLNFASFNVGDGPAAFLILIVGAIVTVGALVTDAAFEPPMLFHLIWIPLGLALTLFGLRFGKAFLLGQEYRQSAREGRIVE
ncbi:MAG: DUF983 domain-containing protein [Sphingomicrobium sp.]